MHRIYNLPPRYVSASPRTGSLELTLNKNAAKQLCKLAIKQFQISDTDHVTNDFPTGYNFLLHFYSRIYVV